jgi:tripartite-type tricarboxylate transporter receptor subunit TctC
MQTTPQRRTLLALCLATATLIGAHPVQAQDAFPSRPITIIVPFAPGGGNDTVSRLIAEPLSAELKQPVIAVNKLGAGGAIGTAQVAKGTPDGYTIVMVNGSNTTYPEVERLRAVQPAYELAQLEPLALLTNDPLFLAVRADAPYKTAVEFVKAAQAKPNSIDYASSGNLGPVHIAFELLGGAANTSFNQIQYKGVGPALIAVLGGEVGTIASNPAALSAHVTSGKLRPLAVMSDQRHSLAPEAPTLKELGWDVQYSLWTGLYATAGTPPAVIQKLRAAIKNAAASTKFIEGIRKAGYSYNYRDAPEFRKFVDEDAGRVNSLLRKIVKPD